VKFCIWCAICRQHSIRLRNEFRHWTRQWSTTSISSRFCCLGEFGC